MIRNDRSSIFFSLGKIQRGYASISATGSLGRKKFRCKGFRPVGPREQEQFCKSDINKAKDLLRTPGRLAIYVHRKDVSIKGREQSSQGENEEDFTAHYHEDVLHTWKESIA